MASDKVYVDGLRELRTFLRKAGDDIDKTGLKKIHDKVAEPVERDALRRVPVGQSGRLKQSIRRAKGSTTRAVVRAGYKSVPYAGVIHYGGYNNITPQPFLTDALQAKREVVLDMYADELDEFIGLLMKKYNLRSPLL